MKILVDTNFVLTCVKQKIDFLSIAEEIISEKIEWLLPKQVEAELEKLFKRGGSPEDRNSRCRGNPTDCGRFRRCHICE
jgi:rRNA-processing protein FCF1